LSGEVDAGHCRIASRESFNTSPIDGSILLEYDAAGRELARRTVSPLVSYAEALFGLLTPMMEAGSLVGASQYLRSEARSSRSTRKPVLLDDLENSSYYIPGTARSHARRVNTAAPCAPRLHRMERRSLDSSPQPAGNIRGGMTCVSDWGEHRPCGRLHSDDSVDFGAARGGRIDAVWRPDVHKVTWLQGRVAARSRTRFTFEQENDLDIDLGLHRAGQTVVFAFPLLRAGTQGVLAGRALTAAGTPPMPSTETYRFG
jgi:hypothetical protein